MFTFVSGGKLGEKTLRPQTEFVKSYAQLARLTEDSTISITSLIPYGESVMQVTYTLHQDMEDSMPTTSLVHAAFTTAHGRMMLYEYLSIVDQRALYHDTGKNINFIKIIKKFIFLYTDLETFLFLLTDSIAYIARPGHEDLPLGGYLGCLSDQIADDYGPGSFCMSIVAAGAKNYAIRVCRNNDLKDIIDVVKVRGISINSSCSDVVTFDRLKSMVRGEYEKTRIKIPSQIARVSKWRIVTRPSSKLWRVCLNKRRRIDDVTVPYGYKGEILNSDDYDLALDFVKLMTENEVV